MATEDGIPGRSIALLWGASPIKGIREKGITLNGEAINTTSDEDGGWRKLLEVSAEDSVDIALSGITKDHILKAAYFGGGSSRTAVTSLTYPDGAVLTGTFYLANYSETGTYNDATTFSATLNSSGEVTFTPPTVTP